MGKKREENFPRLFLMDNNLLGSRRGMRDTGNSMIFCDTIKYDDSTLEKWNLYFVWNVSATQCLDYRLV